MDSLNDNVGKQKKMETLVMVQEVQEGIRRDQRETRRRKGEVRVEREVVRRAMKGIEIEVMTIIGQNLGESKFEYNGVFRFY